MPAKSTKAVFLHGANQAGKGSGQLTSEDTNLARWEEAFQVSRHNIRDIIEGKENKAIGEFHQGYSVDRVYPEFCGWKPIWYGGVYEKYCLQDDPEKRYEPNEGSFRDDRLNQIDRDTYLGWYQLMSKRLDRAEFKVMKTRFAELNPFYELAVLDATGRTFYEEILRTALKQLEDITEQGKYHYILIGHSMGCAVSYNLLMHFSLLEQGKTPSAIPGALSDEYVESLKQFIASGARCMGLLTFGNYTGYNWCQRLNYRILHGGEGEKIKYQYPSICPKWWNMWTVMGGDPAVIDDNLGNSIENKPEGDRFRDIPIFRIPFMNIGHGRPSWFKRGGFSKGLARALKQEFYI